jgi:predicted MFS family arabinose efflux permease
MIDVTSVDPSPAVRRIPSARVIYATLLLTLINVFNFTDRVVFGVLIQPIKKELQLSDTQIGLLSGFAFVAVYAAVGLPLARLADRVGRRWVLAGCIAAWSLLTAASGFANSFAQLAAARLGVGVGEAGCIPASHALLAELYPPSRRLLPIAIVTTGAAVGLAIALGGGGLVASLWGWRASFLCVGLPGVGLAILVLATLPTAAPSAPQMETRAPLWPTLRNLLRISSYRRITYAYPFYLFASSGLVGWLPAFFMRSHHMPIKQAGLFFGLAYGLGAGFGCLVGGYALQRASQLRPDRSLYLAGCLALLALPFYLGAILITATPLSLVMIVLYGAIIGSVGSPMIAAQQGVIDNGDRATASAFSMLIGNYVGGGLGPLLIGMASETFTAALGADALRGALLLSSVALPAAGVLFIRTSRHLAADAKG